MNSCVRAMEGVLGQPTMDARCSLVPYRRGLYAPLRDRWSVNPEHFGQQILGDAQRVVVAAVTHHEQPTRQPLLEAMRAIARH
jgi:hypothetical protein